MKTLIALAIAAASFTQPLFARSGETVNAKTTAHFNTDFAGASGLWNPGSQYNEVLFYWHNTLMDAFYSPEGELIGTFHHVETIELPATAFPRIAKHYKGYVLKGASYMERPGQEPVYYVTAQSTRRIYILEVNLQGHVKTFKQLR
jgi:hypothetical protein